MVKLSRRYYLGLVDIRKQSMILFFSIYLEVATLNLFQSIFEFMVSEGCWLESLALPKIFLLICLQ